MIQAMHTHTHIYVYAVHQQPEKVDRIDKSDECAEMAIKVNYFSSKTY